MAVVKNKRNAFPINYSVSEHEKKLLEYFGNNGLQIDRGEVLNPDIETYVICFSNRCGSNLLASTLAQDGQIGKAGEMLNWNTVIKISSENGFKHIQEYINWLCNRSASKKGVFGIKLAWTQLYFLTKIGVFPSLLGCPKFIHVVRRDILAQAVSHSIAHQTKQWTSEQKAEKDVSEVVFDEGQILSIMRGICESRVRFMEYFSVLGISPIEVFYEDMVADLNGSLTRIVDQLGFQRVFGVKFDTEKLQMAQQANQLNAKLINDFREKYNLHC